MGLNGYMSLSTTDVHKDATSPNPSSRPRPPLTFNQSDHLDGGRAEGPLPETEYLIEQSARLYLQILLDRILEGEEWMYVYILASPSGTLYTGVTNNLFRRTREHREKLNRGFSSKYRCSKLVYFEIHESPDEAIDREKQIKRWRREKRERLIRTLNPPWLDLSVYLPMEERDDEQ